ncbi:MAG: radical SAM protein [Hyphomicrobiales bacterium]
MKILLIYPYFLDPRLNPEDIQSPPMGIYHVATVAKEGGHDVEILNWHDRGISAGRIENALRERKPQVIGFSILHANRWGGIEIARIAKRIDPGVTVVFGGVGATHLWEHYLKHFPEVDFIVVGEGESAFARLVAALEGPGSAELTAIPGLAFRREGRPFKTGPAEGVCELDALPMPARHFDLAHVSLTRGCVANCTFCGSPAFWGRRVRYHSPDYFVEQLAVLRSRGRRFFYVSDDTFTLDRRRAIEVCRRIVERQLGISWAAISRVDAVDEEVLAWMRRAGCIQVSYGVESGSPEIRRRLNKTISAKQIRSAFALTQRYGIMARAYFIYGCPGESGETIRQTIDLMMELKPLGAVFYILDIFPGTRLYAEMKQRLGVTDDIWLNRVEDIMYFESDPKLTSAQILEWGDILRGSFYRSLPGFVTALDPVDDLEFFPLHADFFSRLAMTFEQGDYARVEAIPDRPFLAETLYRRALGYHPDARAFLGIGILKQKDRRYRESADVLTEGLSHFPGDEHLLICLAVSLMNLGQFKEAQRCLARCPGQAEARRLAEACRQALGRS